MFGEAAIEAYRAIGDQVGTVAATARFGRVLIDASELDRAKATLEAIIPAAEKLDDPSALAAALANLARARMRLAETGPAIEAADRALAIAERLNLEPIIAEGLVNKGSALNMEGRRREAGALEAVALEIAQRIGDRSLELRIRNNYANALSDDDPVGATRTLAEAADVARDIGDRGMYNWLLGMTAVWQIDEGRRWDENLAALKEAYESGLIRTDRLRLRIFIGLIEAARRQNLDEYLADITELSTGGASKDDEFALLMTRGQVAMRRHAYLDAYRAAMQCHAGEPQNPEIPLWLALAGAMRSRDPEAMRDVAEKTELLAGSGALTALQKRSARAAAAAADGRIAEAVAGFQEVHAELVRLGQMYRAATFAIDAAALLPDQRPLRELAESGRPLLEELGAVADLEDLDEALASAASVPEGRAATTSAPARPPGWVGDLRGRTPDHREVPPRASRPYGGRPPAPVDRGLLEDRPGGTRHARHGADAALADRKHAARTALVDRRHPDPGLLPPPHRDSRSSPTRCPACSPWAVLAGVPIHRPQHRAPWLLLASGLLLPRPATGRGSSSSECSASSHSRRWPTRSTCAASRSPAAHRLARPGSHSRRRPCRAARRADRGGRCRPGELDLRHGADRRRHEATLAETAFALAYPLLDLVILAVLVRIAVAPGRKVPALTMLLGALGA